MSRFCFALRYAALHLLVSCAIATLSACMVYEVFYPYPYSVMQGVSSIFVLLLIADAVCGPLLTMVVASPGKSRRERRLDLVLVGCIQLLALAYGLHSVWLARPVVLAFERDRLVLVTANEVERDTLPEAPPSLRSLPWSGVTYVGTRHPVNNDEYFKSMELGLAGISPAMRPAWWLPWVQAKEEIETRAQSVKALLSLHPEVRQQVEDAVEKSGYVVSDLRYLPLTSSKTKEWVAFFNAEMRIVAFTQVDGF